MNFLLDLISTSAIASGIFVITSSNPIISILFLIIVFIIAACYLLILGVSFVGLAYLTVYVGAVAVLFLFIVMMLNIQISEIVDLSSTFPKSIPLGFIIGILFIFEFISIIPSFSIETAQYFFTKITALYLNIDTSFNFSHVNFANSGIIADTNFTTFSQIQSLAHGIFSHNSLNLFLSSIILLVAIIGPILICFKSSKIYLLLLFYNIPIRVIV